MQKHLAEFTLWKMNHYKKSSNCFKCGEKKHREERLYHIIAFGWTPPYSYEKWYDTHTKAIEFTEECKKCGWKTVYRWYPEFFVNIRHGVRIVLPSEVEHWVNTLMFDGYGQIPW